MDAKRRTARQKLDTRIKDLKPAIRFIVPSRGWIRALRDALGMTAGQLGGRIGMRGQSVLDLEKSEKAGTIQLKTLRKAAEALDCTLVYALVPKTSLSASKTIRMDTHFTCTNGEVVVWKDMSSRG